MALLTPFYFLKAGSLVNAAVLYSGIGLITLFFLVKTTSKFIGLFPAGIALAAKILQEKGITPQTLIKYGRPGDVIIKTAEELQADLIVLGTKKHPTLLNKRTIGPIVDKVVEHAHCSVLVVR
jgi:hypothetical protein